MVPCRSVSCLNIIKFLAFQISAIVVVNAAAIILVLRWHLTMLLNHGMRSFVKYDNNNALSNSAPQLVSVNITQSQPRPTNNSTASSSLTPSRESEGHQLERVLKDAAMEDKTVILTTLNAAWASRGSIFDLFLKSFEIGSGTIGLLEHLVVVALDQTAYSRCLIVHKRCYRLVATEGVDFSNQAVYMTDEYLKMMWRRIDFLGSVLELGYNFVFTDTDIMWFRNPFPHFYENTDFQIACDHFTGNPDDKRNLPNGGFNFVRSSSKSIEFYKFWYSTGERYPGKHDQDVLNMIKSDSFVLKIGLKIKFLTTAYFGGLCEPSKDLNLVCTMHANCCVGLERKIDDLKVMLNDWRHYMSLSNDVKKSSPSTWHVPRACSSLRR